MALANGQQVLAGPGLPHALQFAYLGANVTVPGAKDTPNYVVITASQYTQLQTDVQFTALTGNGKITVSNDIPATYAQQQYQSLPTIQAQIAYLKALVITLGGPVFK